MATSPQRPPLFNGHVSLSRLLILSLTSCYWKPPHNGHLFTTGRSVCPKVAVVKRFDCILNMRKRHGIQPNSLHTASPSEIWINQSALSKRQKLYCPDVITQTKERASLSALASQNSSFRRAASSLFLIIYKKGNSENFIQSEAENGSRHLWC